MALFNESMTRDDKLKQALAIMHMGSPLSDKERDEIRALFFLDGLTWKEFHSAANKKLRFKKRVDKFS